jgi:hypothetical protein
MLKRLNENKALIGYAIGLVAGAVWGLAHVTGTGPVVEPYVGKALTFGTALVVAGKTPSDHEARLR